MACHPGSVTSDEVPADETSRATRANMPVQLQARAERLKATGGFLGGTLETFERTGRLQLATLVHQGLYPSSKLLDVGCGSLRAGYWFMSFLEPGRYYGIEPRPEEVKQGLEYIVEPELVEYARPQFAYNDDFDLSVFGTTFDFVVARSIWSHTSKSQIEAMLDSFVKVSHETSVLLASYLPASKLPDGVREPLYKGLRKTGLAPRLRDLRGKRLAPGDYHGDEWDPGLIGHDRAWLHSQCAQRGLQMRELKEFFENSQVWARIERKR
jgi:hypothetical protein